MPNKPRPENRHRMVRVEDDLWEAAKTTAVDQSTTVSAVIREALRRFVVGDTPATVAAEALREAADATVMEWDLLFYDDESDEWANDRVARWLRDRAAAIAERDTPTTTPPPHRANDSDVL